MEKAAVPRFYEAVGSNRYADKWHQMSALRMWWTGSQDETRLPKSGPIPNRE
jgi:hypothetical protein